MHGARWATEMTLGKARGRMKRGNFGLWSRSWAAAGEVAEACRERHVERAGKHQDFREKIKQFEEYGEEVRDGRAGRAPY